MEMKNEAQYHFFGCHIFNSSFYFNLDSTKFCLLGDIFKAIDQTYFTYNIRHESFIRYDAVPDL